jgi:hypothetical protein
MRGPDEDAKRNERHVVFSKEDEFDQSAERVLVRPIACQATLYAGAGRPTRQYRAKTERKPRKLRKRRPTVP